MYVDSATVRQPLRPVLDGEPNYEDIPQGLHSDLEPRWNDLDIRRYAYWSVFAGSCGHTYGHNAIMQFVRPGVNGAYFADGSLLYIGTHSGSHLTIDPRKIPGAPLFLLCPTGHPLCHKYNKHTTRQNPQLTYFNYSGGVICLILSNFAQNLCVSEPFLRFLIPFFTLITAQEGATF